MISPVQVDTGSGLCRVYKIYAHHLYLQQPVEYRRIDSFGLSVAHPNGPRFRNQLRVSYSLATDYKPTGLGSELRNGSTEPWFNLATTSISALVHPIPLVYLLLSLTSHSLMPRLHFAHESQTQLLASPRHQRIYYRRYQGAAEDTFQRSCKGPEAQSYRGCPRRRKQVEQETQAFTFASS